jgi:hypothetical protein
MMQQRQQPIPIVHPGGVQPYHGSTPQAPGMALMAMLAGRTAGGYNPQDIPRQVQKQSRGGGQMSLLSSLAQRMPR